MPNGAKTPVMMSLDLSSTRAREFLRRLGHDDAFRRRLQRNPRKVLAELNIHVSSELLNAPLKLPTKAEINGAFHEDPGAGPYVPKFAPCKIWAVAYAAASTLPEQKARAKRK
jgi:hypothetical protein